MDEDQKKEWETWLSERPEKVRVVAEKYNPMIGFRLKTDKEDIGTRYFPRGYDEQEDGSITISCEKVNDGMPFLGGYEVFGLLPSELINPNESI